MLLNLWDSSDSDNMGQDLLTICNPKRYKKLQRPPLSTTIMIIALSGGMPIKTRGTRVRAHGRLAGILEASGEPLFRN